MPRHESDKEDLIAEAVALVDRAEYRMTFDGDEDSTIVTAGFRRDDSLSLYFNQDPFYQFDTNGLLRRSFGNGFLFRSQGTTLAKLQRYRSNAGVSLMRIDLTAQELETFREQMRPLLANFKNAILSGLAVRLRSVTDLKNFNNEVTQKIDVVLSHSGVFLSSSINQRK